MPARGSSIDSARRSPATHVLKSLFDSSVDPAGAEPVVEIAEPIPDRGGLDAVLGKAHFLPVVPLDPRLCARENLKG